MCLENQNQYSSKIYSVSVQGQTESHFPSPPTVFFSHNKKDKLTTASTCDLSMRIPVCYHLDQDMFEEMLILSLKGNDGFGRVYLLSFTSYHLWLII